MHSSLLGMFSGVCLVTSLTIFRFSNCHDIVEILLKVALNTINQTKALYIPPPHRYLGMHTFFALSIKSNTKIFMLTPTFFMEIPQNFACLQYLSTLKLWVQIPLLGRCIQYNITWSSLSVTCDRSLVFSGDSDFIAKLGIHTTEKVMPLVTKLLTGNSFSILKNSIFWKMVMKWNDTKVVSSNPALGKVYSIQHYVIKFVSDLRQVAGFLRGLWFPPPI
jgi:hypothetical protein